MRLIAPEALVEQLRAVENDPVASEQAGVDWAARQIRDLMQRGAPGVHLYILNRSAPAIALARSFDRPAA